MIFFQLDNIGKNDGINWPDYFKKLSEEKKNHIQGIIMKKVAENAAYKERLLILMTELNKIS